MPPVLRPTGWGRVEIGMFLAGFAVCLGGRDAGYGASPPDRPRILSEDQVGDWYAQQETGGRLEPRDRRRRGGFGARRRVTLSDLAAPGVGSHTEQGDGGAAHPTPMSQRVASTHPSAFGGLAGETLEDWLRAVDSWRLWEGDGLPDSPAGCPCATRPCCTDSVNESYRLMVWLTLQLSSLIRIHLR